MTTLSQLQATLTTNQAAHASNLLNYFTWNQHKNFAGVGRSGSVFEFFGGRGDVGHNADRFTYQDCLAPSFLSVNIPAIGAYRIVEGDLATSTSAKLSQIPKGVPLSVLLWQQYASVIDGLFQELKTIYHIGSVGASKLMARKRPDLIPILDNVLYEALDFSKKETGKETWSRLATWMSDATVISALSAIQQTATTAFGPTPRANALNPLGPSSLSLTRVLDICIWEEHHPHRENPPTTCLFR
jgi:hypothetical protein